MKNGETKVTVNGRGTLTGCLVVLALGYSLGVITTKSVGAEPTRFTRDELYRIVTLQEMEDKTESGADIVAYKDKDGNLMIGWEEAKTKKKR